MRSEPEKRFGTFLDGKWVANAIPTIMATYAKPEKNPSEIPDLIEVNLSFESGANFTHDLAPDALTIQQLKKAFPLLVCSAQHTTRFEQYLMHLLQEFMQRAPSARTRKGYYFDRTGLHILPSGQPLYVLADQILGECQIPCKLAPQLMECRFSIRNPTPFPELIQLLAAAPPQVSLVFVFVIHSFIASYLRESGYNFDGVLYISGKSGVGKSELARRATGWYLDARSGQPALQFEASSTTSGLTAAMAVFRDVPMLIDDICLTSSKRTQQKRIDLASDLCHRATNHKAISKAGPGGVPIRQLWATQLIMTAELNPEEESDLTRCVLVPIQTQLLLPDALTSQLFGDSVAAFLKWLLTNFQQAASILRTAPCVHFDDLYPRRTAKNLQTLSAVCQLFQSAIADAGCSTLDVERQFQEATQMSLRAQGLALKQITGRRQRGSLAEIMLEAYENCEEAFRMTSNLKKLKRRDGIIWRNDFCLRRDALEHFIHSQPGFQNVPLSRIVQQMKDWGALVIQEDGTATVHIGKKGDNVPRVYRIRPIVLKQTVAAEREIF